MAFFKVCIVFAVVAAAAASPAPKASFWKDSFLGSSVEEMRSMCDQDDAIACLKYKFVNFVDSIFQQDTYKVSDSVEINRNTFRANEISSRSDSSLEDHIENYVKSHDATFKLPGATVTLGTKNLDQDELDLNVKFSNDVQARGKSKIKKIMIPILIFILIKAIILIPLALGVLGLKAWNALQLSFFSFVISISLAVFQLCKKLAADAHPPIAHGPWESAYAAHYKRSFDDAPVDGQQMAYAAYVQ